MFIVSVTLKNAFGPFHDNEVFVNHASAVERANEWASLGNVAEVAVTTPYDVLAKAATNAGLLVGLGRALGFKVEVEEAAA